MENQHRKINGYRELSQAEIDLMNEIKAKGEEIGKLVNRLEAMNGNEKFEFKIESEKIGSSMQFGFATLEEIKAHETRGNAIADSIRWTGIAKDHLQLGLMALTRAVARPTTF